MLNAVKKMSWLALVLILGGLAGGCGGFSGTVPISSMMFLQNTPAGSASGPNLETVSTNTAPDLAFAK